MAVENRYHIQVNTKSKMFRVVPEIVANDNVVFEIELYDGATLFPLLPEYTYRLVSLKKASGKSVIRDGAAVGGLLVFDLGTSEMTDNGKVEATVQVFDVDNNRVSSAKFDYEVRLDPSLQGSLPADDTSLVIANESLLTDAINKADAADQRITDIISTGTQLDEVKDARGTYPILKDRLSAVDASLSDNATVVGVNLSSFPRITGETDDTGRFKRAVQAMANIVTTASSGLKLATEKQLTIPSGIFDISDEIMFSEYANIISEGKSIIRQNNSAKRIFVFNPVYSVDIQGIKFINGTNAIYFSNANVDTTMINVERCEFHYQSDYAVKTLGTATGDTHMSANITLKKCKFVYPNGVLYNVCDLASVENCWVQVGKTNFQTDRAVFYNKGGVLVFDKMFGVPTMGTDGTRLAKVRWVDNYDRFKAINSRFGGEDEGIPIVYNFSGTSVNNMGGYIVIENCQVSCGLRWKVTDAGVVYLKTQVPQLIRLQGNDYVLLAPYIGVDPSLNLSAYFSGISNVSQKFTVTIDGNMTWSENLDANAIPLELLPYFNKNTPLRLTPTTLNSNYVPSWYNQFLTNNGAVNGTYTPRIIYCAFGDTDTANPNLPVASAGVLTIEKVSTSGRLDSQKYRVAGTGVTYYRYGMSGSDAWGSWSTTPKASNVRATQTISQTVASPASKLSYQTEVYDDLNEYDPTTSRFTATNAGVYLVCASMRLNSQPTGNRTTLTVMKNGADEIRLADITVGASVTSSTIGTAMVKLNVGEYIEVFGFSLNSLTTDVSYAPGAYLEIVKIG